MTGEVLVVSDGTRVARSDDAGCTWAVLALPTQPGRVVADLVAVVEPGVDRVHVLTRDVAGIAAGGGRVFTSDRGGPFELALPGAFTMSGGTPPCPPFEGCHLVASQADPDRLFLLAAPLLQPGQLWRSDDGGRSFTLVHTMATDPSLAGHLAGGGAHVGGVLELNTDPGDRDALVAAFGCERLARSDDGGGTWRVVTRPGDPARSIVGLAAADPPGGGVQRLVAVEYSRYCNGDRMTDLHVSTDAGETWRSTGIVGNDLDRVVLDGPGTVGVVSDEDGALHRVDVDAATVERLATPGDVRATDPARRGPSPGAFVAVAPAAVLLLDLAPGGAVGDAGDDIAGLPPLPPLEPCTEAPLVPRDADPSSLAGPTVVVVPEGGSVTAPLDGLVGGGPVPVDVGVLLDTSGSMEPAAASLARSVERAGRVLLEADVDAHVGLARFADLQRLPYQRLLGVGPIDCRVRQRLGQLEFAGVTEPHLLALGQVVTGDGVPAVRVPSGEQLDFRDGALRLVVHVTDEPVQRGLPHSPDLDEVVDRFATVGASQVGIHVIGALEAEAAERVAPGDVRRDLAEIARATGAVAGRAIDCDGDGLDDLTAGDPVVCGFDPRLAGADGPLATELGSVLAQVVDGLVLPEPARVVVTAAPAGLEVLAVGGTEVDPRTGGEVPASLEVTCPASGAAGEGSAVGGPVELALVVGERTVATAAIAVQCGDVPTAASGPAEAPAPAAAGPSGGGAAPLPPPAGPPPAPAPVGGAAASGAAVGAGSGAASGAAAGSAAGQGAAASGAVGSVGQVAAAPGAVVPGARGRAADALAVVEVRDVGPDPGAQTLTSTRWHAADPSRTTVPAGALSTAVVAAAVRRRRPSAAPAPTPVRRHGH